MQKCGRRLFVTKKLDPMENRGESHTDNIIDVTLLLDKVVLGDKKEEVFGGWFAKTIRGVGFLSATVKNGWGRG